MMKTLMRFFKRAKKLLFERGLLKTLGAAARVLVKGMFIGGLVRFPYAPSNSQVLGFHNHENH